MVWTYHQGGHKYGTWDPFQPNEQHKKSYFRKKRDVFRTLDMNRPHYLHLEAFSQHHTRDLSYVLIFMNLFWDQKTQSLIERIKFLPFVVLEIGNVTKEFANTCRVVTKLPTIFNIWPRNLFFFVKDCFLTIFSKLPFVY